MEQPWLIKDACFFRVAKPRVHENGVDVFGTTSAWEHHVIESVRRWVMPHKHAYTLLRNSQNLFVLIGSKSSENCLGKNELKWADFLKGDTLDEMNTHGYCTLGMILVSHVEHVAYIEWVESFIRGYHIADLLIEHVRRELDCWAVVPQDVACDGSQEARNYWKHYFQKDFDTLQDLKTDFERGKVNFDLLVGYDDDLLSRDDSDHGEDDDDVDEQYKRRKTD